MVGSYLQFQGETNMATKLDSSKFSKDNLDAIVNAFYNIADGFQPHDFASHTGNYDPADEANFAKAQALVYAAARDQR
jgi:hypothetical protein